MYCGLLLEFCRARAFGFGVEIDQELHGDLLVFFQDLSPLPEQPGRNCWCVRLVIRFALDGFANRGQAGVEVIGFFEVQQCQQERGVATLRIRIKGFPKLLRGRSFRRRSRIAIVSN